MLSNWVPVQWGWIGVCDYRQAGPCMSWCMGRFMGGAWVVVVLMCLGGSYIKNLLTIYQGVHITYFT